MNCPQPWQRVLHVAGSQSTFVEFSVEARKRTCQGMGSRDTEKGKMKVRVSKMERVGPEKVVWTFFQQALGSVWRGAM